MEGRRRAVVHSTAAVRTGGRRRLCRRLPGGDGRRRGRCDRHQGPSAARVCQQAEAGQGAVWDRRADREERFKYDACDPHTMLADAITALLEEELVTTD